MKQVPAAVVEILIKKSQFTLNWDLVPLNPKIEFWTGLDTLSFDYPSLPPPPPSPTPPQLQGDRMWRLISVSPVDTIFVSLIIPSMVSVFSFRSQHFLSGFSTPSLTSTSCPVIFQVSMTFSPELAFPPCLQNCCLFSKLPLWTSRH